MIPTPVDPAYLFPGADEIRLQSGDGRFIVRYGTRWVDQIEPPPGVPFASDNDYVLVNNGDGTFTRHHPGGIRVDAYPPIGSAARKSNALPVALALASLFLFS